MAHYLVSFQETLHEESSSHPRLQQSDDEHILGTTCTEYSEKSDRLVL